MINYELKLPATPATKKTRSQIARDWMVDKAKRPSSDGYYNQFKKRILDARKKDEEVATTKKKMNQASNQFNLGYEVFQKDWYWFIDFFSARVGSMDYTGWRGVFNFVWITIISVCVKK